MSSVGPSEADLARGQNCLDLRTPPFFQFAPYPATTTSASLYTVGLIKIHMQPIGWANVSPSPVEAVTTLDPHSAFQKCVGICHLLPSPTSAVCHRGLLSVLFFAVVML